MRKTTDSNRILLARIYDEPTANGGARILVDRLWPRGVSKDRAKLDLWLKEIAPTTGLRQWFGHDPAKWTEFRKKYHEELAANSQAVGRLAAFTSVGQVTLLYAAKDEAHNEAVVIRDFVCSERTPPRERFAHDWIQFDLHKESEALASEPREGHLGHRQIALYKHGGASASLFRFKRGGSMPEHKTEDGTVCIQVIEGRISLTMKGEKHSLETGGLLVLAPGIPHDVLAEQDSVMLLMVCLDR